MLETLTQIRLDCTAEIWVGNWPTESSRTVNRTQTDLSMMLGIWQQQEMFKKRHSVSGSLISSQNHRMDVLIDNSTWLRRSLQFLHEISRSWTCCSTGRRRRGPSPGPTSWCRRRREGRRWTGSGRRCCAVRSSRSGWRPQPAAPSPARWVLGAPGRAECPWCPQPCAARRWTCSLGLKPTTEKRMTQNQEQSDIAGQVPVQHKFWKLNLFHESSYIFAR